MIEEKLQRKLKNAMLLVICMILVFFTCGGLLSVYLQKAKNDAVKNQIVAEAEEYKSRVKKQLEADFQILSTLSVFITENNTADRESLARALKEANQNNHFVTLVFYDRSGMGVIASADQEPRADAALSELSPEGRRVVEEALKGNISVSQLFESDISDTQVFVYSVPVYDGDELIGALAASDNIEIFSDILSGNTVLSGGGYIHMLNSEGVFLIRSPKMIVQEDIPSIFDGPYLSDSSRDRVQSALSNQERIFSSFSYEGNTYPFLLEPVGVNNWYLFCVNTGEGLMAGSSTAALVSQVTLGAVLLAVITLMLWGYRLLQSYNQELIRLAYHDSLTGAENLVRFRQRLAETLGRTEGSVTAVCVRQFAFINEIFGKEKADQLLVQMKIAAESHLEQDEFFCRDGEDRFYLFMKDRDQEMIRRRLSDFMDEIQQNSEISHTNYQLAIHCGVALSDDRSNPDKAGEGLLTSVQFALDKARQSHTSSIWFFDAELHKKEELENYVESHMHQALRDGEFKLFLQPKKDLKSGMLCGAEALVRWSTGSGRMIFPDQFIPLFERNGFCVQLDLYMVEQACRQIRSWMEGGITPVPISVNQSKLLFFEEDYVGKLTELVKKYHIPPRFITLEILEGLALENVEELNAKILQLQGEGFKISLDDFGSGFSSLNTLGKLKIDELKLDRDFLMSASDQKEGRVRLIMEEIIRMAGRLGISTVAEGVEITEDEELLLSIGCDVGQGYLYSKPISAEEFDEKYMSTPGSRGIDTGKE